MVKIECYDFDGTVIKRLAEITKTSKADIIESAVYSYLTEIEKTLSRNRPQIYGGYTEEEEISLRQLLKYYFD